MPGQIVRDTYALAIQCIMDLTAATPQSSLWTLTLLPCPSPHPASLYTALPPTVRLGLVPKELRLVGGGSKNKLWQQIVADVFQLPVR